MEEVNRVGINSAVPLSIKQVDLDGYDIVPPVHAYHNTFELPHSSFYSFSELQDDIAKAISAQNNFPHRRVEAKRDFYFKLSAHYRRHTDEKRQDVRVTAHNWDELRLLLLSDEVHVACFSVLWWKKTTGQRRADRAEVGRLGLSDSPTYDCEGSLRTHSVLSQLQLMVANTTPQLDSTEDTQMDPTLAGRMPPSDVEVATAMRSIEASIFGHF
ncbi:hypothetical protein E4T45_05140 [Aureobasidium sp. EXF-8846]|nr:hypothetical protein E4T45_05140 [Aureobasidium sp. EXF-8846]